jgi:very-short-patch-repair endonuclease
LADGCQQGPVTPGRLRSALQLESRLRWRSALASIIDDVAAGAYSVLEHAYIRKVERAHGLPRGKRQACALTTGGRVIRDVHYEQFGVICELDGRLGHEDFIGRTRDRRRDNIANDLGLVTYRFGYLPVLDSPCSVALTVSAALKQRGWRGRVVACGPSCEVHSKFHRSWVPPVGP